jgi:hypothetical protein
MVDREKLLSSRGSTGTVVIPESSRVRAQGVGVTVGVVRAVLRLSGVRVTVRGGRYYGGE